ncbi:SUMF1/EgtB/PvdO family nonheme iron enzyme [Acaryochloris sp. CCMEE 5410]|uniref:SUMF1/EgtB/PvdO family nonheme iron enzyme n=1 Tax=Acaryochloris sp. CCMEE 5410 TaxID=310037 RepID=UPI0002483A08|nr:SUMF1/EgtB/PvdO family nonheme iron enzyme [Acaryochloris sp. CCMEE 5410]KAI9130443.1 SUMF1/EgtB/PvdO family nonheme iron enzyme [Acaryochloris sp. CCMEE 5410]
MGKNWAIAIGINDYQNMRPLKFARKDAEAVCQFFQESLHFDKVDLFAKGAEPVRYEDGPPLEADPTVGNLDTFFDVRFERPFLEPGDNLWFFFAGHGKRHKGRDYLMPIDGSPRRVEKMGIAIDYIAERLRRSGADNVILMIDACRGEDDRDGGEGVGRQQQKGIITLFACSPKELSYEIEEIEQGAFTHTLLAGLQIQGAGNCATVERLSQYLKVQVPEVNRRYNKPTQTPYTRIEPESKLHFILLPRQATLQDVAAMKIDALEAEAENDLDGAEHLWTRVLAASPADMQAIKGLQRIAVKQATSQSPRPTPTPSPKTVITRADDSSREPGVNLQSESEANLADNESSDSQPLKATFTVVKVNAQGKVIEQQENQAEQSLIMLPGEVPLSLVRIPEGQFWMGAQKNEVDALDTEYPRHQVSVPSFWMGQYSVTQRQWQAVAGLSKVKMELNPDCSKFTGETLPVEKVSWYQAIEFCERLSRHSGQDYRLPTEAEWEYACRAGTETPFYCGETITTDQANYYGDDTYGQGPKGQFRQKTTAVGSFAANAFGLFDMHGNVWEWCLDHWHEDYTNAPTDGTAWLSNNDNHSHVLRGGSWGLYPRSCRSASRGRYEPGLRNLVVGFRVVCVSARAF